MLFTPDFSVKIVPGGSNLIGFVKGTWPRKTADLGLFGQAPFPRSRIFRSSLVPSSIIWAGSN